MTVGIYKLTAQDIMTTDVVTIRARDTVHAALTLMSENRLAALPVVDEAGLCVGIVSQADVVAMAREKDLEDDEAERIGLANIMLGVVTLDQITNERVEDIMSDQVVLMHAGDLVTDVADKMLREQIHHIPVVNANQKLIGIVSTMDILGALRAPTFA